MVRAALAMCVVASNWRDALVEESILAWAKKMMETLLAMTGEAAADIVATLCCPCHRCPSPHREARG
jgi:hypothetical protein